MGIGVSVFLLALGAILSFAVSANNVGGVSVHAIGYILMAAGVIGLLFTMLVLNRTTRGPVDVTEERVVRDRRDVY